MLNHDSPHPVRQSGVIPFRFSRSGSLEVLIITTRRRGRWIVPKGHLEAHLTPAESAACEAREEAGVEGTLTPRVVGSFAYTRRGRPHLVELYPMIVTRTHASWPERAERRRLWTCPADAERRVAHPGLTLCIRALRRHLASRPAPWPCRTRGGTRRPMRVREENPVIVLKSPI